MIYLVGSTGFVGSNLMKSFKFDRVFNSKNIKEAYGSNPDVLYYAGITSKMFLSNTNPELDKQHILDAINNIKEINPKKIILISTIAVYDNYNKHDEDYVINEDKLSAYGKNRLYIEKWLENSKYEYLILRLPALFGENLSKNFLFDIIHQIPNFLNESKFDLVKGSKFEKNYIKDNSFYKLSGEYDYKELELFFKNKNFSTLSFTDSRSVFQFYNLNNLFKDIDICLKQNIKKINLVSEPLSAQEVYKYATGETFISHLDKEIINQNLITKYYEVFNGKNGYIYDKYSLLEDIKEFIKREKL